MKRLRWIVVLVVGVLVIVRRYGPNIPQTAGVGSVAPTTNIVAIAPTFTTTPTFIATPTTDETHVALTHERETAIAAQATAIAAQENATGTAISAQEATTAAQNETETAIAVFSQTAQANAVATRETVNQQATATVIAVNKTVTSLQRQSYNKIGPFRGQFTHDRDESIEYFTVIDDAESFILNAQFDNPYDSTYGDWDFGFAFSSKDGQYRLIIMSNNTWRFIDRRDDEETSVLVNKGDLFPEISTTAEGSNTLTVYVYNEQLWFYLNGEFIKEIELDRRREGDVWVGIGFYENHERVGEQTNYDDVILEILPSR